MSLNSLDISDNKLIPQDIENLALIPTLKKLDISDMDLSDLNLTYFGKKLSDSSLYEFVMNNNRLSDDQMEILIPFIVNSAIHVLTLSYNKIGTPTLKVIANYPNKSLEALYLDNNRLRRFLNEYTRWINQKQ